MLQYFDKVVKSQAVVIACGTAFLISVFERMVRIGAGTDDIARVQQSLSERVTRTGEGVDAILRVQNQWRQPLLSLPQCMKDLDTRLQSARGANRVVIRHLGLDMSSAWDELKKAINSCDAKTIHCDVLIMTDDPTRLGPDAPDDMKAWCESVPSSIKKIGQDTATLGTVFSKSNRSLTLTLRKYSGTPRIHGFTLTEPFERGYVSFASWGMGSTFELGGDDYFTFSMGSAAPADHRLRELLNGAFEQLWRHPTSADAFVYPPPASPHGTGQAVTA